MEEKKINLWNRPGGTLGKIIAWAAVGGFLVVLYKMLPILITLASNVITLILMLILIWAILALITNPEFKKGFELLYLQVMRKITGLIIEIDPVNILALGVQEMEKKLVLISSNIDKLQGLLEGMKKKRDQSKEDFLNETARLQAAKLKGIRDKEILSQRQIVRLQEQIKNQETRIANSEKYLKVMKKLEEMAKFQIEDASNELKVRKDEYEQSKAQKNAMKSFAAIMSGKGLTKSLEVQLALDQITDSVNESLGQINRFLDGSNDILLNYELDGMVAAEKADKILEEFDKTGFEGLGFSLTSQHIGSDLSSLKSIEDVDYEEVRDNLPQKQNKNRKYF